MFGGAGSQARGVPHTTRHIFFVAQQRLSQIHNTDETVSLAVSKRKKKEREQERRNAATHASGGTRQGEAASGSEESPSLGPALAQALALSTA